MSKTSALIALFALAIAGGCTVQPLYQATTTQSLAMQQALSGIAIKPVDTRAAQMVRNRLIFLFGQGAGEAQAPTHTLELVINDAVESAAVIQRPEFADDQPTAKRLDMTARYRLTDLQGTVVASGVRVATANFDTPDQGFALRSAQLDAQDRAARELAEMLQLAIAQGLAIR
jgi:LPS-assembly lipoprotein